VAILFLTDYRFSAVSISFPKKTPIFSSWIRHL